MGHGPPLRRVRDVDRLVGLALTNQRLVSIQNIIAVPAQSHGRSPWVGDLGSQGIAADEVMVQFGHVVPSDLDGSAVAGPDVHGINRARHLPALHHFRPLGVCDCPNKRPRMLREATLYVVDEVSAPAETLDAKLFTSLVDSIVDRGTIGDWAMQFVGQITRHADAGNLGLDPVDATVAEAEKADVTKVLTCCPFEKLQ